VLRVGGILLAAAALSLAGCTSCSGGGSSTGSNSSGGSSSGSETLKAGVSASQACQDMAAAACGQLSSCSSFGLQIAYGDATTCAQRLALGCMPMIGAPGSTVTPNQIDQCAQVIMAETCDEWLDNSQPSACSFMGSLAAGSACSTGAQCQSGFCRLAPASICGTCDTRASSGQRAPEGGPACVVDADCAATLVCAAGTCVAPAAAGSACSMTQPCSRTLSCIGSKCATPIAVGGACTALTDCDGTKGGICNTNTKKCIQTGTAPTGSPCGIVNGGITSCTGGASCANISTQGQGTCHQPAPDGSPCGLDVACMGPAVCTTTAKCTLPNPGSCH
jgi:hypothetical protein